MARTKPRIGHVRLTMPLPWIEASGFVPSFRKPPKTHPLYAAVGRVAAEWAELEHNLDQIIWRLSGTTAPLAACITSQMIGHFPRFNAIVALVRSRRGDNKLIQSIEKEQG